MGDEAGLERIRTRAREFTLKEISPYAAGWDAGKEFPEPAVKGMGEMGYMGVFVPEEYGGMGLDYLAYTVICEEISRGCSSCGAIMSVNNSLTSYPLLTYGSEQQKRMYLVPMARGEILGCFAQTEPNAGSDPAALSTAARRSGDGYIVSGTKRFITTGKRADIIILFAVTDPGLRHRGISAFIVEKGWDGVRVEKVEEKMGIRASDTAELVFEDVHVPEENMLGSPGQGFKIAMDTLDGGRIGIGAQAVGIAQRCLDESLEHARSRVQFGKPIGKHQAISGYLADMAMEISASRLLVQKAAARKNLGKGVSLESAMAKMYASDTAMRCAVKAVQILGADGADERNHAARLFRDAKITQIYEGTNEIMRYIIARHILR